MSSFQVTWGGQGMPSSGKIFARRKNKNMGDKKGIFGNVENTNKVENFKQKTEDIKIDAKSRNINKKTEGLLLKIKPKKVIKKKYFVQSAQELVKLKNKKDSQFNLLGNDVTENRTQKLKSSSLGEKFKNSVLKPDQQQIKTNKQNITKIIKEGSHKFLTDSKSLKEKASFSNKPESWLQNTDTGQDYVRRKKRKDKAALNSSGNLEIPNTDVHVNRQHSLFSEKHKNIYIHSNVKGKSIEEKVFGGGKNFRDLEIHRHLISNLEKHKLNLLTNIQEKSIPVVISGKNVLIRSQTGSGKTLTYVVPILDALVNLTPRLQRSNGLQAIIVVPTRELALQIHEVFNKLNTFQWIVAGHLCGGENRKTEKDRLRKGVHILVGTPGRLLDHILHTAAFDAKNVRCLVLDEADQLLNMGFMKDITRLVEEIENHKKQSTYDPMALLRDQNNKVTKFDTSDDEAVEEPMEECSELAPLRNPKSTQKQIILLSATLTRGIVDLTNFLMKDHVYIDTSDQPSITEGSQLIIPKSVKQEFLITFVKHRLVTLSAFILSKSKEKNKTFIFMATTQMVDFHYELFSKYLLKIPKDRNKFKMGEVVLMDDLDLDELNNSDEEESELLDLELFKLHGNMDQSERKDVFNRFRKCQKGVLICSDVAARGIDVPEADCIVQYTAPQSNDDYLHRVGRTGRAGKSGSALIFLTHEEQEYISRLRNHNVFLQESKNNFLADLTDYMMEPDSEKAISALQKRYETAITNDKQLHSKACFAYSSWSRFYSSYSREMKGVFERRKCNLGHYCTSFGLKETPSQISKSVRGQVEKTEPKRLNKKLANHDLVTSEFSRGLKPARKRKKLNRY